jgi:hypothetical protein
VLLCAESTAIRTFSRGGTTGKSEVVAARTSLLPFSPLLLLSRCFYDPQHQAPAAIIITPLCAIVVETRHTDRKLPPL